MSIDIDQVASTVVSSCRYSVGTQYHIKLKKYYYMIKTLLFGFPITILNLVDCSYNLCNMHTIGVRIHWSGVQWHTCTPLNIRLYAVIRSYCACTYMVHCGELMRIIGS